MKREWVFINHLAQEQGISHQRFYRVLKDAPLKRNKKGQVDRKEAMVYYEEHTQQARRKRLPEAQGQSGDANESGENSGKPNYLEAQARKEAAVAALKELELMIKRGELVYKEDVKKYMTMLILQFKGVMKSRGSRLAARLAAEADRRKIEQILKKDENAVLAHLEEMKL